MSVIRIEINNNSKKAILNELDGALKEVNDIKAGKQKRITLKEMLNEN